jgi:NIPSNAP
MKRREFLASSLAASTTASFACGPAGGGGEKGAREFYELRYYQLRRGKGVELTHNYVRDAEIPALNRIGILPIGVFNMMIGPGSPSLYVLIPHRSLASVFTAGERLRQDQEYLKQGADFLNAPASDPAFVRVESMLMAAFGTPPRITPPPKGPRVFELRTYENATKKANLKKIEMFMSGEIDIFHRVGFHLVFFGETLIGPRWPNVTYMMASASLEERDKHWAAFSSDPEWKKLSSMPEYSDQEIVSNITNYILGPAPYSQI